MGHVGEHGKHAAHWFKAYVPGAHDVHAVDPTPDHETVVHDLSISKHTNAAAKRHGVAASAVGVLSVRKRARVRAKGTQSTASSRIEAVCPGRTRLARRSLEATLRPDGTWHAQRRCGGACRNRDRVEWARRTARSAYECVRWCRKAQMTCRACIRRETTGRTSCGLGRVGIRECSRGAFHAAGGASAAHHRAVRAVRTLGTRSEARARTKRPHRTRDAAGPTRSKKRSVWSNKIEDKLCMGAKGAYTACISMPEVSRYKASYRGGRRCS